MRILACLLALVCASATAAPPLDATSLRRVPLRQLPFAEVQNRVVAAQAAQRPNRPLQFAVEQALSSSVADGSWDYPDGNTARWRLRVASSQALSLSFRIDNLKLPESAELWLYGSSGADAQGPYTAADVTDNGSLWLPIVRSSEAVIEARMPLAAQSGFSLKVARAFHGFRSLGASSEAEARSFSSTTGDSNSCEKDAICQSVDWGDDLRSVVLVVIGGSAYCTGTLMNNAAQNNRPLVLTANHCRITTANATTTRAYFNVQRSGCGSGAIGSVTQNIAGSALRASSASGGNTDFALLELASSPPTSYGAYYAGWDARTTAPTTGASIHHPKADDKKIALFTSPATQTSVKIEDDDASTSDFTVSAWKVTWSYGITEPGSSGSGLLNQNHRLVGTLSGGNTECALVTNAVTGNDYFARLDQAYTATSATGQTLKTFLDPNNLGCTSVIGRDTSDTAAAGCETPVMTSSSSGTTTTTTTSSSESSGGALDLWTLAALCGLGLFRPPSLGRRRAI